MAFFNLKMYYHVMFIVNYPYKWVNSFESMLYILNPVENVLFCLIRMSYILHNNSEI